MKIAVISDSPTVTTGFGITTDQAMRALHHAGHQICCVGLKASAGTFEPSLYPGTIWPFAIGVEWLPLLDRFLAEERPDALLINMDIFNLREWVGYCNAVGWVGPTIAYLIMDGVPTYSMYLDSLSHMNLIITTTRASAEYLRSNGISVSDIAPPGVDRSIFRPLRNRKALRRTAGVDGKFVVGVFGRNTERKQQARVLKALASLAWEEVGENVLVYFHCNARGYWHLDELSAQLEVDDRVVFADQGEFNEIAGVPYLNRAITSSSSKHAPSGPQTTMPPIYTYVERMSCCDLIVNPSSCGDFEQVIIEAQSCGIPIAGTNDNSIMAEAMGEGGILLDPVDTSYWTAGQEIHLVSPAAIAQAIIAVKTDETLARNLKTTGIQNANQYPWERLWTVLPEAVSRL